VCRSDHFRRSGIPSPSRSRSASAGAAGAPGFLGGVLRGGRSWAGAGRGVEDGNGTRLDGNPTDNSISEDTSATGVSTGGGGMDISAMNAGAVYVYR
jgi:hypothetical protein